MGMDGGGLVVRAAEVCDRCGGDPKVFLAYGPHRFCAGHFTGFFEHRVRKTMRTARMVRHGEKIAVGVSGGKDSMVTLHLLDKVFGKTGQNKIVAIVIDEGIPGYRDRAAGIAASYCEANGIECHVVDMRKELGVNTEEAMKEIHGARGSMGSTCSYCGVFRRRLLNTKACELGADKLATGHNMDDEAQSILMNFVAGDFTRMSRLGETAGSLRSGKMVQRIKPLYETPEKDVVAYAALNGIEHYSDECCPYSWMAKRNQYRKVLNDLENSLPGTKHSVMAAFRKLKPMLAAEKRPVVECEQCGELSASRLCAVCTQMGRLVEMSARPDKGEGAKPLQSLKKPDALTCAQTKGTI